MVCGGRAQPAIRRGRVLHAAVIQVRASIGTQPVQQGVGGGHAEREGARRVLLQVLRQFQRFRSVGAARNHGPDRPAIRSRELLRIPRGQDRLWRRSVPHRAHAGAAGQGRAAAPDAVGAAGSGRDGDGTGVFTLWAATLYVLLGLLPMGAGGNAADLPTVDDAAQQRQRHEPHRRAEQATNGGPLTYHFTHRRHDTQYRHDRLVGRLKQS